MQKVVHQMPLRFGSIIVLQEAQIYALIRGAMINLSPTDFGNAISGNTIKSDPSKAGFAILKRGGKEGQELFDAGVKCDDKTISRSDESKARCLDIRGEITLAMKTIIARDYGRAVFKLAGYSFDKSLVVFANDCDTFGSCNMVVDKILELTNNTESTEPVRLFIHLCSSNDSITRKRFLPLNVAAACVKMMGSSYKEAICGNKDLVRKRSICNDEVGSKTRYCTETGNLLYPEFDCN